MPRKKNSSKSKTPNMQGIRSGRQMVGPKEAKKLLSLSDRLTSDRIVDFIVREQAGEIVPGALHWLSDGLDIMGAFMWAARSNYVGDLDALDASVRQAAEDLARKEWEGGNGYSTAGVCPRHVILAAATLGELAGIEWAFLSAVRTSPVFTGDRNAYIRADNLRFKQEKRIRDNQETPELTS